MHFGPAFYLMYVCRLEVFEPYGQRCALYSYWWMVCWRHFCRSFTAKQLTVALSCTLSIYPLTIERQYKNHSVIKFFLNSDPFRRDHTWE